MNNNATDHKTASQVFKTWSYETDQPGKRLTLQAVGRQTEVHELDEWGERTPCSRIVAIGSAIDAGELDEKFDRCLAT